MTIRITSLAAALALAALTSGCGDSPPKAPGQVVAKVNGKEITIHQVRNAFSQAAQSSPDAEQVSRQVLDTLIDEHLLLDLSKTRKLERDPQVMHAIDQSRRQILARAMQESLSAAVPRPTAEEVQAFYVANPALFEKRRVYTFHQVAFDRQAFSDALKTEIDKAKSEADIATALKAAQVVFREQVISRSAEQLPIESLPKVASLPKGGMVIFNDMRETSVLRLKDSFDQPATLEQATPIIEQYLINAAKKKLIAEKTQELRAGAQIEYLGTFANAPAQPQPAPEQKPAQPKDFIGKGLVNTVSK